MESKKSLALTAVTFCLLTALSCDHTTDPGEASIPPPFSASGAPIGYTAMDLGTLGGTHSEAWAINDAGRRPTLAPNSDQ